MLLVVIALVMGMSIHTLHQALAIRSLVVSMLFVLFKGQVSILLALSENLISTPRPRNETLIWGRLLPSFEFHTLGLGQ